MRKNERSNRDSYTRNHYSIFDFTWFGMIVVISIIVIGSFMRVVF